MGRLIGFLGDELLRLAPQNDDDGEHEDDEEDRAPSTNQSEALGNLRHDNYKLREQKRGLKTKVTDLEHQLADLKGKVPAEGAVVLSADQAKAWQAYQTLGTPEALQSSIAEARQLQRNVQLAKVADAAKWNAEAFEALDRLAGGLTYEVREVQVEEQGQKKKLAQVFVKTKGADGVEREQGLAEYVQQHHAALLPALTAQGAQERQGSQQQGGGTKYVPQNAGDRHEGGDYTDRYLREQEEKRKAEYNPLAVKKTT